MMKPEILPALCFRNHGIDAEDDEGYVFVRAETDWIGIGVSLKSNGDLEIGMEVSDAKKLVERLQEAIATAEG